MSSQDWATEVAEMERIAKAQRRPWVPDANDPKEHWHTGQSVGGKVVAVYDYENPSTGSTHPVVEILTTDDEVVSISCSRTVLSDELAGVKVGDIVHVSWEGLVEREGRKPYHRYRVLRRVHGAPDTVDETDLPEEPPDDPSW